MSSKERKKEAKNEKKKRAEDRHRQKYLDKRQGNESPNHYEDLDSVQREVGMLKI